MFDLTYSPKAHKVLKKFPKDYQKLILNKVLILKNNPRPRGYDKISAKEPPLYRIRIGDYRVFYFIDQDNQQVIIVDIKRRTTQTYH